MSADVENLVEEHQRAQRCRDRRRQLRMLATHYLGLPWTCSACGALVPRRRVNRHAAFHHIVNLLAWNASGGRGRKPRKPVIPTRYGGTPVTARVIGIDPGLANLGVAELTYDGHRCTQLVTRHEKTHPPATPTDDQTAARMTRMIRAAAPVGDPWLCEGCGYTHNPAPSDLVMVMLEGPSYGSTTPYQHDSAGLWWRLRSLLTSRGIAVGKCPPATLKLWAAGDGRASKDQMKLALDRLWPGVLARTEHEVDAALLALAAAQRLGWFTGGEPLRQARQLGKMTWPRLPEVRTVPAAAR